MIHNLVWFYACCSNSFFIVSMIFLCGWRQCRIYSSAMSSFRCNLFKRLATLLLAGAFALGLLHGALGHGCAEEGGGGAAACHIVHCGCHAAVVFTASQTEVPHCGCCGSSVAEAPEFLPRLALADIFKPPKA